MHRMDLLIRPRDLAQQLLDVLALRNDPAPHQLLRPLHDLLSFIHPDIRDLYDTHFRSARTHPVHGLHRSRDDRRLRPIQTRRSGDRPLRPVLLRFQCDIDAPDLTGLLELPELKLFGEQPLSLTENCAYDVVALHDTLDNESSLDEVLRT